VHELVSDAGAGAVLDVASPEPCMSDERRDFSAAGEFWTPAGICNANVRSLEDVRWGRGATSPMP
jgi:hypothetical protein